MWGWSSQSFAGDGQRWTPAYLGDNLYTQMLAAAHGTAAMVDAGAGVISSWGPSAGGGPVFTPVTTGGVWSATSFYGLYPGITFDGSATCYNAATTGLPIGATGSDLWVLASMVAPVTGGAKVVMRWGNATVAQYRGMARNTTGNDTNGSVVLRDSDGTTNVDVGTMYTVVASVGVPVLPVYFIGQASFGPALTDIGGSLNGAAMVTGTLGSNLNTANTRARIGGNTSTSPSNFWNGVYSQIVVTKNLSALLRSKMQGYLAWTVPALVSTLLPVDHAYHDDYPRLELAKVLYLPQRFRLPSIKIHREAA